MGLFRRKSTVQPAQDDPAAVDVAGYGMGITLAHPFAIGPLPLGPSYEPGAKVLVMAYLGGDEVKNLLLEPDGSRRQDAPPAVLDQVRMGNVSVLLGSNVRALTEVATPSRPEGVSTWLVRTSGMMFEMPPAPVRSGAHGRAVEISLPGGDDDEFVYLRGPWPIAKAPAAADLLRADQDLVDSGEREGDVWVHVEYEHLTRAWAALHRVCLLGNGDVVWLSAQALVENVDQIRELWEWVGDTLH